MTALSVPAQPVTTSVSTVANPASALPLRHDDPVTPWFVAKLVLIMVLLLAAAYVALRWYARHLGLKHTPARTEENSLQCVAALRLSTQTKVYLLKAGAHEVLLTEHVSGNQVTILGKKELIGREPEQPASHIKEVDE